jgi:hypothetical protein
MDVSPNVMGISLHPTHPSQKKNSKSVLTPPPQCSETVDATVQYSVSVDDNNNVNSKG